MQTAHLKTTMEEFDYERVDIHMSLRAQRSNRMLYRAALLPCDCHAALAMTWFLAIMI